MRDLHELPKLRDGLGYLYIDHGRIEQAHLAIECIDEEGGTQIPAAGLAVLMLGPGTSITHAAVRTLADNGCLIVWCGQDATRFYALGTGETRKAHHLLKQAELASDPAKRLNVVMRMYRARFKTEPAAGLTIEQLRGMEGVRVRDAYARASREFGIPWAGRNYDRRDWNNADPVNRALSAANACLNGICHAAIVSGGYSPGLGFIHTGKQLSFVYDIADLYKAEITIPLAFRITATELAANLESTVRKHCRIDFHRHKLLERILPDIGRVLDITDGSDPAPHLDLDADGACPAPLWDGPPAPGKGGGDADNGA